MSGRVPTEKQYRYLRNLGSGSALVIGRRRETEMYLRRGWVTALGPDDDRHYPYAFVRITPDGLRALAEGVERYGLPDLGPRVQTERRVCADCGSGRYRFEYPEHDVPAGARA